MSAPYLYRYKLVCDGCKAEHLPAADPTIGFGSTMEARADAYSHGWRFPHRINKNGTQASRTSDVCPDCAPGWEAPRAVPDQGPIPADDLRRRPRIGR